MEKKNLVLGGILIILLIFAYVYQGPLKEWRENRNKIKNFLNAVSLEKIIKIEIKKENKTVILEREEERWKVGGTKNFYADESAADDLNFVLKKINQTDFELAGDNKEKRSDFGTDESGIEIKIIQADDSFVFVIGKTTVDFSGSYISRPDSDKTYKIGINLDVFDQGEWRDKQIFSFKSDLIDKMRFQYPDRQFWVEKAENEWKGILPWPFVVSDEKITKILETMGNLRAVEIPEQNFAGTGLEKHLIIVQVIGENTDETIMIGQANGDGLYYAKRADSDNIYLISEDDRNMFNKRTIDFK